MANFSYYMVITIEVVLAASLFQTINCVDEAGEYFYRQDHYVCMLVTCHKLHSYVGSHTAIFQPFHLGKTQAAIHRRRYSLSTPVRTYTPCSLIQIILFFTSRTLRQILNLLTREQCSRQVTVTYLLLRPVAAVSRNSSPLPLCVPPPQRLHVLTTTAGEQEGILHFTSSQTLYIPTPTT